MNSPESKWKVEKKFNGEIFNTPAVIRNFGNTKVFVEK
jgi:hypothetical protein